DWNDHKNMFDYGFECLSLEKLEMNFDGFSVPVVGGPAENVGLDVGEQPSVCVDGDEGEEPEVVYKIPEFVYAPVKEGEKVGVIEYYKNGVYSGQSDVTAAGTVGYKEVTTSFVDNVVSFFLKYWKMIFS
ncbi:MAG: hypothetical protein II931_04050, partial [Clostridia bacterium]|nr:hypothetical protein [Clostridia bacterium]